MKTIQLLLLLVAFTAMGQTPLTIGRIETLSSKVLGESRTVNVYLPDGYDATKSYPAIYLLDGSANEDFLHIAGLVQFLSMSQLIPPTLVFGIANVDRRRDFTFPTSIKKDLEDYPTTGKSAKFIAFLETELEPFLESRYKVSSRTLIGQSLGGLLAVQLLAEKPNLFDRYLIVSPSLWWDNESLLTKVSAIAPQSIKAKIFLAVGNEGAIMVGDAKKFADSLQKADVDLKLQEFPNENHATILHNAAYAGILALFGKS